MNDIFVDSLARLYDNGEIGVDELQTALRKGLATAEEIAKIIDKAGTR